MARSQVREVSGPAAIQGVSTPVNTYVRPADPAPSSFHQLAEGIAALDSGMGGFLDKRKAKTEAADKQRAIRDAYVSNGAGFDEGTKNGSIPPQESPTYMSWYKTTQGDVQGRKLRDQFAIKYQTWEGRNSGDPKAFQTFVGQFLQENLGDSTDPEVLAGLNPHIEALQNEAYGQFTTDRSAAVKGGALSTSGAILTDNIERAEADGRASGQVDYEKLWADILPVREEALKRNLAADYDPVLVDAIILQAEEAGNEELLGLLEKTLPGQDHPISYDIKVREKRDAAIARIQSGQASKATTKAAAEDKADKDRHNALVAVELKKINDDPNYIVPEETLKDLSRRDPEFRTKLGGYRKSLISDGTPEDPEDLMEVYAEVDAGKGSAYVNQMRKQGVIKDPETYTKLLDRVEKMKTANKPGGTFDSPAYKDNVKLITNATGQGDMDFMDHVRGLTGDGARALFTYRNQLLQWEADNPDLANNGMAREKAAMEIGKMILDRIIPDPTALQQGLFPESAAQSTQQAAPLAPPAAPLEAIQPQAEPSSSGSSEPVPGASPARQEAIAELAKRHGITPQEAEQFLLEEDAAMPEGAPAEAPPVSEETTAPTSIFDNLKDGPGFSPLGALGDMIFGGDEDEEEAAPVDPDPVKAIPEADRIKLQDLLSNPPKREDGSSAAGNTPLAPMLNLLGKTEGTDRGDGYNETLAYGAFTNGDVDLEHMTLDQVDKLQTDMLSHPDNTMNSSAVGRYQVIRTTLRGLRQEMGLDPDALYDKAMQDKIAMHLLERRGLSRWQAGEMSDAEFMDSLAKEWASLPTRTGKGNYKGQRAGVGVTGMLDTLGQVRGGGTQVASLDPSSGFEQDIPPAYAKIPAVDGKGEDQIAKFKEWNPDPVGNHSANLAQLKPDLQSVITRAKEIGGQDFVIGSGVRNDAMQKKAVQWGWSQTEESDHLDGSGVDLWPLDKDGAVVFDKKQQLQIVKNMKQAAKEMGVKLDIGADWKGFKDLPHFAIKS